MLKITYFILEDIPAEVNILKENLEAFQELEYVGHAGEITDAVSQILQHDPDLIFWDHSLTGGTGFDVLERLEKLGATLPLCVGTSAYKNFNLEIYSKYQHLFVHNFNKPFFNSEFDNRIRAIILKVRKKLNENENYLHEPQTGFLFIKAFTQNNPVVKLEVANIVCLVVETTLVTIYLADKKKVKVEIALSRLLSLLHASPIKQVNRNTAVNIAYIERYENGKITLAGSDEAISLSENFKRRFEATLNPINF